MQENAKQSIKNLFQLPPLRKDRKHLQEALRTGERHRETKALSVTLHFLSFCQLPPQPLNIGLWAMPCFPTLGHIELPSTHLIPRPPWVHKRLTLAVGMPASKFSLAVQAHGKHGLVLHGPLGLDKIKTISLHLNSGPMWAILLLAQAGKFEGSVPDPTWPSPSNLLNWFMCHCLPPFFFSSNLFPCSICLFSVSGHCHGLQLHS